MKDVDAKKKAIMECSLNIPTTIQEESSRSRVSTPVVTPVMPPIGEMISQKEYSVPMTCTSVDERGNVRLGLSGFPATLV